MADFRHRARRRMPRMIFDFVDGAAGSEMASRLNIETLEAIRLQPRVLVNVEGRQLTKTLFGHRWGLPFGIAPMGMCNLFWPGADTALAATATERNIPLCLSTMGSTSIERMFGLARRNAWFQLYVGESLELAMSLMRRAENAGYEVLVLTVDVPVLATRVRDQRNGFEVPFRAGPKQLLDFACHPSWALQMLRQGVPKPANVSPTNATSAGFSRESGRALLDWDTLAKLRDRWPGKLVVKGVLSPDDARRVADTGADAVYVSNHGGRQLDSAPAAVQMLPRIRSAVGSDYPLIFDSGVRSGESIVKALAMGADFVMLGRPFLYALGAAGEAGLQGMVDMLARDISVTLAQIGRPDIEQVDGACVVGGEQETARSVGSLEQRSASLKTWQTR